MLRVLSLLVASLLFVAVVQLPIGYYTFLRITVTLVATLILAHQWRIKGLSVWVILFGAIAILFNPVQPIYLHNKTIWTVIDVVTGLIYLGYAFIANRSSPQALSI